MKGSLDSGKTVMLPFLTLFSKKDRSGIENDIFLLLERKFDRSFLLVIIRFSRSIVPESALKFCKKTISARILDELRIMKL